MKKIVSVIGVFVLILIIVPVFLPSHFSMSRSIDINVPIGTVFSKLTDLNEYIKWNPFPEGDPTNVATVTGSGVGSFLIWKGEKTGEGKMTIASIEVDKKIDVKMEFYKPMSGEGMVSWITNAKSESTTELIWTFDQDMNYFNRYFGLFMEAMMGKHFEKGLSNFKSMFETNK